MIIPVGAVLEAPDRPSSTAPKGGKRKEAGREDYYVAGQWRLMWWKFRKHKPAVVAGIILILLYGCAIFADFLSPSLPNTRYTDYKFAPPQAIRLVDTEGKLQAPFIYGTKRVTNEQTMTRVFVQDTTKKVPVKLFVKGDPYKLLWFIPTDVHLIGAPGGPFFLLGTDDLGRDLLSRILYGSRLSLSIGLVGVALTFILGLFFGGLSGYLGGLVDNLIQRTIDVIICVPTIPLWMALAAALPRDWSVVQVYTGIVVITSAIRWTGLARVVRGKLLSLREEAFCEAARLAGATDMRVIWRHLIPSMASYIIVSLTLSIPATILGETSLSFLGLGLQSPAVSWGVLLRQAQSIETLGQHPWLLWPAAWIIFNVLMFNFLGDGLRDAADPYK